MAWVCEQFLIAAPPDRVWAAVRDVGAAHRLFPGVLTDAYLDENGARIATFASGAVVRELIVALDDDARRLAYTAVEGPLGAVHHHSTLQVLPAQEDQSEILWMTDVLPHELAGPVRALMRQGSEAMREALEGAEQP